MKLLSLQKIFFFITVTVAISTVTVLANDPVILRHADVLIGERTETVNTRTLIGKVQLQQRNVFVTCDTAIQNLDANIFFLKGNVVIKQETLTLKSQSVVYDGNSNLATSDKKVFITDRNNKLVGNSGNYSTNSMIANFFEEVILEDDSIKIFANFITYHRQTTDSRAIGNVTVKSKNSNVFLQSDTIDNFPNLHKTVAWGNPVLFQIDTVWNSFNDENIENSDNNFTVDTVGSNGIRPIEQSVSVTPLQNDFTLDTLSIKSDTMFAFREPENEHYIFIGNVEFVRNDLQAKSVQAIYFSTVEQIILAKNVVQNFLTTTVMDIENTTEYFENTEHNNSLKKFEQAVIWLDSTQLHSDSIVIILEESRLKNIHSFGNSIVISLRDTVNLRRIDQLAGDEIILFFANDSLRKIESIGAAKSVFFSENSGVSDGLIEATSEKIIIEIIEGKAENIYLFNQIPGKYHPEPFVFGLESNFYLPNFKKSDDIPIRPEIRHSKILE